MLHADQMLNIYSSGRSCYLWWNTETHTYRNDNLYHKLYFIFLKSHYLGEYYSENLQIREENKIIFEISFRRGRLIILIFDYRQGWSNVYLWLQTTLKIHSRFGNRVKLLCCRTNNYVFKRDGRKEERSLSYLGTNQNVDSTHSTQYYFNIILYYIIF